MSLAALGGLNYIFEWVLIPPLALKAAGIVWFVLGSFLVGLLVHVGGDAARYLHVAPPNIEIRRRIREAGIQLLEKLHSSEQYDRIILVGHSLGSVIGYDVLTHLWTRYHDAHVANTGNQATAALTALEALARESTTERFNVDQYQAAQSNYLAELKEAGNKWLVSDFVTLGSPLAHGSVLLARNETEFTRKKDEREFPTCPPTLEVISVEGSRQTKFTFKSGDSWVPHHAAVFAPTRWTNLYFPCRWTFWGDLIGGPLAPSFGLGIRDIVVKTRLRLGMLSHTLYWVLPSRKTRESPSWVTALQCALQICENKSMQIERATIQSRAI
jgi:hypothetical protein